ncbi:MAG: TIGR03936 family radical SAM-associated protein [Desulfocucumaceae bacterium]
MPRYRIRYSKGGTARYISHLDMLRTFERAVRRAGLPVSLSQGFNPHPRFSFGLPLPVGISGLNEYVDLDLEVVIPPDQLVSSLDSAMPPGITVTGSCLVEEKEISLMAATERSDYLVRFESELFPGGAGSIKRSLEEILNLTEIPVTRLKKDGRQVSSDIRPGLLRLLVKDEEAGTILVEMDLITGSSLNVRPREVIALILDHCGLSGESCIPEVTRSRVSGAAGKDLFE